MRNEIMDINEVSAYLKVSKRTVYKWVSQRMIPSIKIGRLLRFRKEDIETWLEGRIRDAEERRKIDIEKIMEKRG